jgi:hypothetical protein
MKLASVSAANARNLLREKQRRDRAMAQVMRTQYPQFASLRLDFAFADDTAFTPAPQVTELHPPARAHFVFPCPYPDCDGAYDLSEQVGAMAKHDEKRHEGQLICAGQRNRDRNGRSPCQLALNYSSTADIVK